VSTTSGAFQDEFPGEIDIAGSKRLFGLQHLRTREPTHPLDRRENVRVCRRLVARERHELGDIDALVAHPLDAADDVQQRCDKPKVACDRRLPRQQRQRTLVYLPVAPVDSVIIGDDHPG